MKSREMKRRVFPFLGTILSLILAGCMCVTALAGCGSVKEEKLGFKKTADFMLESGMIERELDVNSLFY